jgi:hypothetical protein
VPQPNLQERGLQQQQPQQRAETLAATFDAMLHATLDATMETLVWFQPEMIEDLKRRCDQTAQQAINTNLSAQEVSFLAARFRSLESLLEYTADHLSLIDRLTRTPDVFSRPADARTRTRTYTHTRTDTPTRTDKGYPWPR